MYNVNRLTSRLLNCREGTTAIEYSLIAALISIAIIGALTTVGTEVGDTYDTISTTVQSAGN